MTVERRYPRTHDRLCRWGEWINAAGLDHLGWNVYNGDTPASLRVQKRNDLHSDSVFREVANLRGNAKIMTTHSAWSGLPTIWRAVVWCKYVRYAFDLTVIGQETGIGRRDAGVHLRSAVEEIDRQISGLVHARTSPDISDGELRRAIHRAEMVGGE